MDRVYGLRDGSAALEALEFGSQIAGIRITRSAGSCLLKRLGRLCVCHEGEVG